MGTLECLTRAATSVQLALIDAGCTGGGAGGSSNASAGNAGGSSTNAGSGNIIAGGGGAGASGQPSQPTAAAAAGGGGGGIWKTVKDAMGWLECLTNAVRRVLAADDPASPGGSQMVTAGKGPSKLSGTGVPTLQRWRNGTRARSPGGAAARGYCPVGC